MHYFVSYTEVGKEPFAGQIKILEEVSSQNKSIHLIYKRSAIFYKAIWYLFCKLFLSSHLGFMFLGIGFRPYHQNNPISFKDLNFCKDDTLVICNQTAPLGLLFRAKKSGMRIIRWSDLPLNELFDQRYRITGLPRYVLLLIEKIILSKADCFYTNQRSVDIHDKIHNKKAEGIITRAIKDEFYVNKQYSDDGLVPFHLVFLGVDIGRKKLIDLIKIHNQLRKSYLVDLIIIGPDKIDLKYDESCTFFYGNLKVNELVTLLSKTKSRGFINIVFTRDEGAPIATLELQALGTICYSIAGGGTVTYLASPILNQFSSQTQLMQSLENLMMNKHFLKEQQTLAKKFASEYSKTSISKKLHDA